MTEIDMTKILSVHWYAREGRCVVLLDEKRARATICYPAIGDVVLQNRTVISELHRKPGEQEVSVVFKTPVACEIEEHILKCPRTVKAPWEERIE